MYIYMYIIVYNIIVYIYIAILRQPFSSHSEAADGENSRTVKLVELRLVMLDAKGSLHWS